MILSEADARDYVGQFADKAAMERLDWLASALIEENQKQNLISKPSEQQIWQRHIADSVQLLRFVPRETWEDGDAGSWLDLGTGAGFPGLIIAAIAPNLPIFLVESRRRRADWLEQMASEMKLRKCEIKGRRLEMIAPFPVKTISARAFAPLPKLLSLSAPFSTEDTVYLLPKGRSAAQELAQMPESGGLQKRSMFHVEQSLTDSEAGIIVSN